MKSVRKLHPSLQIKARKELNEIPSRSSSDLLVLREWLKKQPHLQKVNPSDQWLIGFLRGNKFSLQRCKEKIDLYYTLRTVVPEIFRNRDPFDPIIQDILQMGYFLPFKDTVSDDATRICFARINETASKRDLINIVKVSFMIAEIMVLEDDNFIVAGQDILVDLEGTGLNLLIQWTPALAKKIITSVDKAFPVRFKSCHILHTPPGFETAFALLKAFISEKSFKRFFAYSKIPEDIYNIFPKDMLPKEYGGGNGTPQDLIDHWKAKVESYREWFLLEDEQHSDESLRRGEPKTTSSLFGVEGSFRKLEVD